MRSKHYVGVVDFHEDDEDERIRYCPACLDHGYYKKLGAKIVLQGTEPEPDHDLWLQCYECFSIYPKYSAKSEQTLDPFAETSDNPFEDKTVIESAHARRNSPKGKKSRDKRQREKHRLHHPDTEIDEAIRRHGEDNVRIVIDTMQYADSH